MQWPHTPQVIGFDPAMPKDVAEELGIHLMELDDLWGQADFITLHTPMTPDTKHLINDANIAKVSTALHSATQLYQAVLLLYSCRHPCSGANLV